MGTGSPSKQVLTVNWEVGPYKLGYFVPNALCCVLYAFVAPCIKKAGTRVPDAGIPAVSKSATRNLPGNAGTRVPPSATRIIERRDHTLIMGQLSVSFMHKSSVERYCCCALPDQHTPSEAAPALRRYDSHLPSAAYRTGDTEYQASCRVVAAASCSAQNTAAAQLLVTAAVCSSMFSFSVRCGSHQATVTSIAHRRGIEEKKEQSRSAYGSHKHKEQRGDSSIIVPRSPCMRTRTRK